MVCSLVFLYIFTLWINHILQSYNVVTVSHDIGLHKGGDRWGEVREQLAV